VDHGIISITNRAEVIER